tara:strand:+ start:1329 stop:1892 length:564 start_codon:yes stop_codon:yes gene_type:complete
MNNQTLVIYDYEIFYEMLYELKKNLNFNIINISKNRKLDRIYLNDSNYLIISKKKLHSSQNQILFEKFPIEFLKLIEIININFLKRKYGQQAEISIGSYKLNLNSRIISNINTSLNLTERETNIITFLNDSKKPIKISKLQTEVWGHNSKLETHTVETHIYRLRKKINETFHDNNFIESSKQGYSIK